MWIKAQQSGLQACFEGEKCMFIMLTWALLMPYQEGSWLQKGCIDIEGEGKDKGRSEDSDEGESVFLSGLQDGSYYRISCNEL